MSSAIKTLSGISQLKSTLLDFAPYRTLQTIISKPKSVKRSVIRLKPLLSLVDYSDATRKHACLHPSLPLASPFIRDNLVTLTKSYTSQVGQPGANLSCPILRGPFCTAFSVGRNENWSGPAV